jgi:glycopeptide antibiotics resistance protein
MFHWFEAIKLNPIIYLIRGGSIGKADHLSPWILYSLPQGLWVYSLTIFLGMIWYDYSPWCRTIILISSILISVSVESLQLLKIIPGTFDITDLVLNIFASIVAVAVLWMKYDRKEAIC